MSPVFVFPRGAAAARGKRGPGNRLSVALRGRRSELVDIQHDYANDTLRPRPVAIAATEIRAREHSRRKNTLAAKSLRFCCLDCIFVRRYADFDRSRYT